jgi:hypothetical protein
VPAVSPVSSHQLSRGSRPAGSEWQIAQAALWWRLAGAVRAGPASRGVQNFASVAMNFELIDPRPVMLSNPGLVFRITLPVMQ